MLTLRELTHTEIVLRIVLAIVLGGVVGTERGLKNRPAGLRTYILVCLGSCIVMLINQYTYQVYDSGDPVRMGAQVISGIGFLGAGTIIVTSHNQIKGLTTAAGLWASACVGLAIGIGLYEVAVVAGICIFLILSLLHTWDYHMRSRAHMVDVYIELGAEQTLGSFIRDVREMDLEISNLIQESNAMAEVSFTVTVKGKKKMYQNELVGILRRIEGVKFLEVL